MNHRAALSLAAPVASTATVEVLATKMAATVKTGVARLASLAVPATRLVADLATLSSGGAGGGELGTVVQAAWLRIVGRAVRWQGLLQC